MARKAAGEQARLAVVLSGVAARAAALVGALQALEEAGQQPDLVVGVSGGAIAGALYAATGTATAARDALYELVARHSWQDLADIDFGGLEKLSDRPYETPGLLCGEALQAALLASPIGRQGFGHLARPLLVQTVDLNSGREVIFANQTQEAGDLPYRVYARTAADLEAVNVATACRAAASLPGLFRPLSLEQYCLVDGALRLRRALAVAAAQPGVTRLLWLHAGLDENETFSLVTDYAGQSFGANWAQALTVAAADAFDPHSADPALAGKAVRFVNLAVSGVGVAETTKTQALYESGRRSVTALLAPAELAGGGLFSLDAAAVAAALGQQSDEVDGPRWTATVGAGGGNLLALTDRLPTLQQEFGYEFEEYLQQQGLPALAAKEPVAVAEWAAAVSEQSVGLGRLTAYHCGKGLKYVGQGLLGGLSTAWRAVGGDKLCTALSRAAADAALKVSDTLSRPKPPAPPAAG
ncbi:MAG: patatin-like phospholipase family protein [Fimbriimonadaceae bacterium]|nr:patatin-like phospholipase family protein [Fimbriimonadaceae bacterium]